MGRNVHIFEKHIAFIATPIAMSQSRNESPRVDFEQRFRLLVRVYFNILIWDGFDFERYPDALHEGTVQMQASAVSGCKWENEIRFGGKPTRNNSRIISSRTLWNVSSLSLQLVRSLSCDKSSPGVAFYFGQSWSRIGLAVFSSSDYWCCSNSNRNGDVERD
jgi:hypothetical protein